MTSMRHIPMRLQGSTAGSLQWKNCAITSAIILYLIDYTIMNEQICNWLEEELGMKDLADQLQRCLQTSRFSREICTDDPESIQDLQRA